MSSPADIRQFDGHRNAKVEVIQPKFPSRHVQSTTSMDGIHEGQRNAEAGPSTVTWPSAPTMDWSTAPRLIKTHRMADIKPRVGDNFYRTARWCMDGSAIMTMEEDRKITIFDTDRENSSLNGKAISQPDAVHATAWYPTASTTSPETFCFVASVRDNPVRLIDATNGRIRATYSIIDHRERFIAPHSLAFNPSASRIYCGFENAIEVFDISNPGANTSERLKTTATRKDKGSGQKGIISALAFCPDYSGTFAAGSYSGNVAIYSEDTGGTQLQHLEGVTGGGVTQVAFHPLSPTTIFVASRRSDVIQVFDLRDTSTPIAEMARDGDTNQRLTFDVDPWGRYLASGDQHGTVKVWDISDLTKTEPILQQRLLGDSVGSVQLHPFEPLLLTASGSRSYLKASTSDDESGTSSSDESDDDGGEGQATAGSSLSSRTSFSTGSKGSLNIWSFGS